ncbi:MAG: mandelate racemase/muconate lactonizing enzyme family protein [Rickettsiales bacterium]|nr:mandelate racemase/muconate lactonizing enzyme family protein [Rickettsiales bacterium]
MTIIDSIAFTYVRAPLEKPVSAFGMTFSYRDYLLCELACDDGSRGIGFSYVGVGGGGAALRAAEDLLSSLVVGQNPETIHLLWQRMYDSTLIQGRAGVVMNAISAVDIALWDRKARVHDVPLAVLLGGDISKPIPAYASGGYYAKGKDVEGLRDEVTQWKEEGFKAVKIKAGKLSLKEEEARIAAVREVMGDEAVIMIDLYNAMSHLSQAVTFAKMYEAYDPYWLEDPFKPDEIEKFIQLAQKTHIPLATGEFHYSPFIFETLIKNGASTIIQHEAPRVGGITQWLRIANLIDGLGGTVNPCWFHQLHSQLIPSIAGGEYVEYFPDQSVLNFDYLIEGNEIECTNGMIHLPKKAGLGFTFNESYIRSCEHERITVTNTSSVKNAA